MRAGRAGSCGSSVHFQPLRAFQIAVAQVLYPTNWQQLFNFASGSQSTVEDTCICLVIAHSVEIIPQTKLWAFPLIASNTVLQKTT